MSGLDRTRGASSTGLTGARPVAALRRLERIVEESSEFIGGADAEGRVEFINRGGLRRLGYPETYDVRGTHIAAYQPGWAHELVRQVGIPTAVREGAWSAETALLHCDGREIPVLQKVIAHRDDEGRIDFLSTCCSDITAQKRAAEELRESNERFRLVAFATNDAVWVWEPANGIVRFENFALVQGYQPCGTPEDLYRWLDSIHPDDRERIEESIRKLFVGTDTVWINEYRVRRADGSWGNVLDRGFVERDAAGRVIRVTGASADVTEHKRLEQQLLLADRLASLGSLAAGVVHEVNNPLAFVMSNLHVLASQLARLAGVPNDLKDELVRIVQETQEGTERMHGVMRDLKTFSAPEAPEQSTPVDLRDALGSALTLAHPELRLRARVVTSFGAVPLVRASCPRLVQVFLNLLINAAHAIEPGRVAGNEVAIRTFVGADGLVAAEVQDTGCGIPARVAECIFDPFFTTKAAGKGTGLGLAICQRLVGQMGGRIEFESAEGVGTTFRVLLPAVLE